MYNLNYTYLADLPIDTSRSARDISASALFIAIQGNDYSTPVTCITNRFVEWFFATANPNIPKLDVTFKHLYLTADAAGTGQADNQKAIVSKAELLTTISNKLTSVCEQIKTKLEATITTLNANNVMPVGTIVVNKNTNAPVNGSWKNYSNLFLGETRGNNVAPVNANKTLNDINLEISEMPAHKHEVILSPETMSKTANISTSVTGNGAYFMPAFNGGLAIKKDEEVPGQLQTNIVIATDHYDGGPDQWKGDNNAEGKITKAYTTNLVSIGQSQGTAQGNVSKSQNIAPPIDKTNFTTAKIFEKTA